jgi:RNA polymerase sigma-70 factor, ECF subfamily
LPGLAKFSRFERSILPHLDAAYNLARWLMRNEEEAADAV